MKKKVQIVAINPTNKNLQEKTINSFNKLNKKTVESCTFIFNDIVEIKTINRQDEAKKLNEFVFNNKNYDYLFIITNESRIPENFEELLSPYVKDEENKTMYMPIIELAWYINEEDKDISSKGFLNSCLWKPYLTNEIGKLDEKLARRHLDTTLFGCLIPVSLFETFKFNEDLKFFYQFDFLNQITHNETKILGIPKCSLLLAYDYEIKAFNQEEKKEEFKLVQQLISTNV